MESERSTAKPFNYLLFGCMFLSVITYRWRNLTSSFDYPGSAPFVAHVFAWVSTVTEIMYEAPSMSVKRTWDWSTVATCFPHGPEIAVRVAGGRLHNKIALVAMLTICLIITKRDLQKFKVFNKFSFQMIR